MQVDYYTIRTSVNIATDAVAFSHVMSAIGFFSQPLIIGEPFEEDGQCIFRFAVRTHGLRPYEAELVDNLAHAGFTPDNTQVVRAQKL